MPVPVVEFTDERLPNGLRLIVAEDHLAPVVAVNVWYDVGSKHEVPGKTGFAHLFEHVMFQGSAHVGKAEHMALVQAAGGTLNGTTWLDRTNYFETLPSHQLELALWLEADRMGTLLDALSQENLDNQREVVKNEKRWSYDNRPYGTWNEKIARATCSRRTTRTTTRRSARWRTSTPPRSRTSSAFFRDLLRAQQRGARRSWATATAAQVRAWAERYFGPIPANPSIPPLARPVAAAAARRARSARRSRTASRCRGCTSPSARRRSATAGSTRSTSPRSCSPGGKGEPAPQAARPRRAAGPGRRGVHAAVRRRGVDLRRLGDGPAGGRHRGRRGGLPRRAGEARLGGAERATSSTGPRR